MDVNSLISNKFQKYHDEERKDHTSINICDLPNEILQAILSNLPIKDAVRTSALSKRWIDQWNMDISKVDLEEERDEKRQQFIHFVGRLLMVCKPSCIKKFSLVFKVGKDAPQVHEWLCGFINPKVQEVNIDLWGVEEPLAFPDHMFTSETLVKLNLCMQHVINIPSSIFLPNLKTLTLKEVIFPGSYSTQQLFSRCPSLEELTLTDCDWTNVTQICIIFPLLQKLIIREWNDDVDVEDDANDVDAPNKCNIFILGANLKTFSYDGDLINNYFLFNTTLVNDATVEVHTWNAGYFVCKFLIFVSNVEKLSLIDSAIEALSHTYYFMEHLPLFHKLVELHMGASELPINLASEGCMTILRKSPILKLVNFVKGVSLPLNGENNIGPLPVCFRTHLKTIKINNFSGKEEELNAIQFLFQKALVLEEIHIYRNENEFDIDGGPERLDMLMEQIVEFPRVADCDIIFEEE
ncbi:F-box/LRR-repeat protein At3g26922-like [Lotus japonicus]|uniref:F-box/LRR-repeat protein At3g26922-like n=1 Tax=Lotus japonicus TaxID=34305 RepID=UPI00258B9058|nr:F-box/LRR-repeat protein At3g26922-like [Lotus japonicus]